MADSAERNGDGEVSVKPEGNDSTGFCVGPWPARCVYSEEAANLAFYIYTGYKFRPMVHNPYFVLDDDEEKGANLAFYIYTGYKFRPMLHNPYFVLDDDEEEAAALEALKDDEFDL